MASPNDHLANERTFLAWVRTAFGIIAFGFLVVRFSHLIIPEEINTDSLLPVISESITRQWMVDIMGIVMIIFGIIVLAISYLRYKSTFRQLESGVFVPANTVLLAITISLIILILMLTALVML